MRLGIEAGADTLEAAVELGIKGVPIKAADLVTQGLDDALSPLAERGLSVCQIGAFNVNPLLEATGDQQQARAMLREAIPLAASTGCPYLVICGGNYHPSGFGGFDPRNEAPDAIDRVAQVLDPLVTLAASQQVKISIEPYLKTVINSPERFFELRRRMAHPEALVANIDVTSLYDYRDYIAPGERCRAVCEGFAGAYGLAHIKDIALEDGFHIKMGLAPLGSSPTDWSDVLRMISQHLPSDSWLILEHVSGIEEARESVAKLRGFAAEADVSLM